MVPPTTNGPAEVEEFDAPDSLTREERDIWLKQSPHAFRRGTLTRASAMAFERYCQLVVMERVEAASSARGGANHRGLLKELVGYELRFLLQPNGRRMGEPTAAGHSSGGQGQAGPVNKLARFLK